MPEIIPQETCGQYFQKQIPQGLVSGNYPEKQKGLKHLSGDIFLNISVTRNLLEDVPTKKTKHWVYLKNPPRNCIHFEDTVQEYLSKEIEEIFPQHISFFQENYSK